MKRLLVLIYLMAASLMSVAAFADCPPGTLPDPLQGGCWTPPTCPGDKVYQLILGCAPCLFGMVKTSNTTCECPSGTKFNNNTNSCEPSAVCNPNLNQITTDQSTNKKLGCNCTGGGAEGYVVLGKRIKTFFPSLSECGIHSSGTSIWGTIPGVCDGFESYNTGLKEGVESVFNSVKVCWEWKCKSGYKMEPAGDYKNGKCVADSGGGNGQCTNPSGCNMDFGAGPLIVEGLEIPDANIDNSAMGIRFENWKIKCTGTDKIVDGKLIEAGLGQGSVVRPFPYYSKCCQCSGAGEGWNWVKKWYGCNDVATSVTGQPANSTVQYTTGKPYKGNGTRCWTFVCNSGYKRNASNTGCDANTGGSNCPGAQVPDADTGACMTCTTLKHNNVVPYRMKVNDTCKTCGAANDTNKLRVNDDGTCSPVTISTVSGSEIIECAKNSSDEKKFMDCLNKKSPTPPKIITAPTASTQTTQNNPSLL